MTIHTSEHVLSGVIEAVGELLETDWDREHPAIVKLRRLARDARSIRDGVDYATIDKAAALDKLVAAVCEMDDEIEDVWRIMPGEATMAINTLYTVAREAALEFNLPWTGLEER